MKTQVNWSKIKTKILLLKAKKAGLFALRGFFEAEENKKKITKISAKIVDIKTRIEFLENTVPKNLD